MYGQQKQYIKKYQGQCNNNSDREVRYIMNRSIPFENVDVIPQLQEYIASLEARIVAFEGNTTVK